MEKSELIKELQREKMELTNSIIDKALDNILEKLKLGGDPRKIRVEFWQEVGKYDFINPAKISKRATKKDDNVKIKECLLLKNIPYNLRLSFPATLLNGEYIIKCYGDCMYQFSMSEKENAIEYMQENNIPLVQNLFKDVLILFFYKKINIEEKTR